MLTVQYNTAAVTRLAKAVALSGRKLPQEMATAVNATAKGVRRQISKSVRTELATSAKAVNRTLSQVGRANKNNASTTVRLSKTARVPLRDFGAKQNKSGVSYRISKRSGRRTLAGAFQGPKPGVMKASWRGHAFKRTGITRLPIVKLFGASPWGAFTQQKMTPDTVKYATSELKKQIERRVRFNVLKASGAI